MFGTKFSTRDSESFYNYYNDISKKVRDRQIDILLVVNMFLTGFDSPMLNTLYVDKNLKQHGLIQAYSRTNRITDERKSQGNIVVFRNLKEETDEAIALFSNKAAVETILMKPYEDYLKKFDSVYEELQAIAPEVSSVDAFVSEDEKLAFIQAFRGLMRTKNILGSFADFTWDDLQMPEQLFEAFKSKYLDLYEEVKNNRQKEKVSVLHEVDFELELIHRDDINVNYILQLLINLKNTNPRKRAKSEQEILDLLQTEITLRSKKDLIEQFIKKNLPILPDDAHIPHEFDTYWEAEKKRALENLTETENLDPEQTLQFIEHCQYMEEKNNRWNETLKLLKGNQPSILERKNLGVQLLNKILDFIDTFINGI
jgi:type I restriction enzyme R subunit